MGLTYDHALGRNQKFYVHAEASNGTFLKPVATDAMAVLTTSFSPKTNRKDRLDSYQSSRDVLERITGRNEYAWGVDAYYVPSGTKNVAPPCGPFLKALLGTETTNANDVTYSQSAVQTLTTLSMTRSLNSFFQEAMWGCWVDEMSFKVSGGDEPKIHFGGGAMGYVPTGYSTLNGAMNASATMVVQTVDARQFGVNSVVQIDDQTNTGAGYKVTVASAAPSYTLEAVVTEDTGKAVIPYVPTWTDAGVPISSLTGSCTWDSLAMKVMSFDLNVKAGLKPLADEAFEAYPSEIIPGFFEITGTIGIRLRKDHLVKILDRSAFATKALTVVVGGNAASGTRVEISMPYCEMEFAEVAVPESEEATVSIPFKALGSSGSDAITWKHT